VSDVDAEGSFHASCRNKGAMLMPFFKARVRSSSEYIPTPRFLWRPTSCRSRPMFVCLVCSRFSKSRTFPKPPTSQVSACSMRPYETSCTGSSGCQRYLLKVSQIRPIDPERYRTVYNGHQQQRPPSNAAMEALASRILAEEPISRFVSSSFRRTVASSVHIWRTCHSNSRCPSQKAM